MGNPFFDQPILNSPYEQPAKHWELDELTKQPTQRIVHKRRPVAYYSPIPRSRKQNDKAEQIRLDLIDAKGLSTAAQEYNVAIINQVRDAVDAWRQIPDPSKWHVTPETARLLQHWRYHDFSSIRPFFCQVEAAETAIWLTEVAPEVKEGKLFIEHLKKVNNDANPDLTRLALKLATGAGKTTVMAMLIAWQVVNAVRHPQSHRFTKGFLIVTPGITIKDRLRVLYPNDPDSYYAERELVPADILEDVKRAKIVITNYHAFKLRERVDISKGGRGLLKGRHSEDELNTTETEGQMLQRVMPDLMGIKNIFVINDEAHHCYREKQSIKDDEQVEKLTADDKDEAEKNNEAARLWISGIETVSRKLGVARVLDLSATPFFLHGSGYVEGTLFPWTMSDFSLMDAIECGIVKLPRVPVADNLPGRDEMPKFRNLWDNIRADLPKKGRGKTKKSLDPLSLPTLLQSALQALYGHYEKTFDLWEKAETDAPPCFIIVCNNTSTSKLVYDYISGFRRDGETFENGRLKLFQNFDEYGNLRDKPRTLLIDSEQLESGEKLDENFRKAMSDEIERFRRERVERSGDATSSESMTDHDLLREVMNTVGKSGQLGASIRCVVSVSMLTEGWDANTVTHVLGVRAFGTQLLCEQVIGRALRRLSYEPNSEGLFDVEYADIFGIPFDFAAEPVIAPPQKPAQTIQVRAVSPERDNLEIRFPHVSGYRTELPEEKITATFTADSVLELTPDLVGPSTTENAGIIGESANMDLRHMAKDMRPSSIIYELTVHLLNNQFRDEGQVSKYCLFNKLKSVVREWFDTRLVCKGGTSPAQLMYLELKDTACERIKAAITRAHIDKHSINAILNSYSPEGSTKYVRFNTSKTLRWETDSRKCHINWVILDSDWEGEFCRVVESHPKVYSYVKNHSLGFEVPYQLGGAARMYRPDFIVLIDDMHGPDDLLRLVVEIKGYRGEDAKMKKETMDTYWIPGVNALGTFGRWAFAEFTDVFEIEKEFCKLVDGVCNHG
ncbi:restriction endonuclease [Synergistales bacterium]|nr:restriction endonuclease [Synergistales bacterium]